MRKNLKTYEKNQTRKVNQLTGFYTIATLDHTQLRSREYFFQELNFK